MPIDTLHTEYVQRQEDWRTVRDSVQGQRVIKARRDTYLPVPPGMSAAVHDFASNGKRNVTSRYDQYLAFGEFPELIAPAIDGFQGIIHTSNPNIELPTKLQYLLEEATPEGEPLDVLWERVTREILTTGRISLLCDISSDDKIRMASYATENLINWRLKERQEGGDPEFTVVQEFKSVVDPADVFTEKDRVIYRELRLIEGVYQVRVWEAEADFKHSLSLAGNTNAGTKTSNNATPTIVENWMTPVLFGKPFEKIPIIVINTQKTGFEYGPVPVMALVRRTLSIYRRTADYNRALYIKGDPQIWMSGVTKEQAPTQIGGESIWTLPNPQAKVQYLDIDGQGIPLMKGAIDDDYERFYQEGGRLMDTSDRPAESGEAIRRRQASNQVSLRSIAQNAGESMQAALRKIAEFMGEDPTTVVFEADLDFAESTMEGRELLDLMSAKIQGAPLSQKSIHAKASRGGITEMTFEEELEQLSTEDAGVSGLPEVEVTGTETGGNGDTNTNDGNNE